MKINQELYNLHPLLRTGAKVAASARLSTEPGSKFCVPGLHCHRRDEFPGNIDIPRSSSTSQIPDGFYVGFSEVSLSVSVRIPPFWYF